MAVEPPLDDRRQRERQTVTTLLRDVRTMIRDDREDLDEAAEGEEEPF